ARCFSLIINEAFNNKGFVKVNGGSKEVVNIRQARSSISSSRDSMRFSNVRASMRFYDIR
ncbi:hypothetical protein GOP47_0015477, partial [Adiantum capillus-veneris]